MTAETRDLPPLSSLSPGTARGSARRQARLLAEAGARVTLQARRKERLDQLVAKLGADRALGVAGGVRDPAGADVRVDAAVEAFGQLDSIVINAGIGMYGGNFRPTTNCRP